MLFRNLESPTIMWPHKRRRVYSFGGEACWERDRFVWPLCTQNRHYGGKTVTNRKPAAAAAPELCIVTRHHE